MVQETSPCLARIDVYPIKSLDGLSVPAATLLPRGALQHDRTFALVDSSERFVNGKRFARIQQVRSRFSADCRRVTVRTETSDASATFDLVHDRPLIENWFSQYLQQPVRLWENLDQGFPDDLESPGPTIISTGTLQQVSEWFDLEIAETRRRFRSNLEISGVPPFWEDGLFSEGGQPVPFKIGTVSFLGINPCQRCVVPTRDSRTGEATPGFQRRFVQQRAGSLPKEVARNRFNHFYRLAVNTRLEPGSGGQVLRVGDPISR